MIFCISSLGFRWTCSVDRWVPFEDTFLPRDQNWDLRLLTWNFQVIDSIDPWDQHYATMRLLIFERLFFFECLSCKLTFSSRAGLKPATTRSSSKTSQKHKTGCFKYPKNDLIRMVWNWPQHFGAQNHMFNMEFELPKQWLHDYPHILILKLFSEWFNIDLQKLLRILALKKHDKTPEFWTESKLNLPIQRGWVEKIQEVFVSPLQSLEYDSIPKSLAAQLLGSIRKKKAMEFWGLAWFFWVLDVELNILKMRKHLLIFLRYASDIWGGNPCPCSQIPE